MTIFYHFQKIALGGPILPPPPGVGGKNSFFTDQGFVNEGCMRFQYQNCGRAPSHPSLVQVEHPFDTIICTPTEQPHSVSSIIVTKPLVRSSRKLIFSISHPLYFNLYSSAIVKQTIVSTEIESFHDQFQHNFFFDIFIVSFLNLKHMKESKKYIFLLLI